MSISLEKGQKISLKKKDGKSLSYVTIGLGWDPIPPKTGFLHKFLSSDENDFDCDAACLMCQHGHVISKKDVISYHNLHHYSNGVNHLGDNLTGDGDGDDEQITVNLNKVPVNYDRLIFVVNIYHAQARKQTFAQTKNAYIRILDEHNKELYRYSLSNKKTSSTALIFGEIYRHEGAWKFNAIGRGTSDLCLRDTVERFQKCN